MDNTQKIDIVKVLLKNGIIADNTTDINNILNIAIKIFNPAELYFLPDLYAEISSKIKYIKDNTGYKSYFLIMRDDKVIEEYEKITVFISTEIMNIKLINI